MENYFGDENMSTDGYNPRNMSKGSYKGTSRDGLKFNAPKLGENNKQTSFQPSIDKNNHRHTGNAGDGPKINYEFLENKPDLNGFVGEAPADGKEYVRKDKGWSEATGGGGGGNIQTFELAREMDAGELVKILNDGKIDSILTQQDDGYGIPSVFNAGLTDRISATKLDDNKLFIAYRDLGNGGARTRVVVTVSGTSFSYGTPVTFGNALEIKVTKIDEDKVFIAFENASNLNRLWVYTALIDGTTITLGSFSIVTADSVDWITVVTIDTNKVFITYKPFSPNSLYGVVATIAGTTPTFGSHTLINSGATRQVDSVSIDIDKVFVAFKDYGNSNYGAGIVAEVTGTSFVVGAKAVFNTAETTGIKCTKVETDKIFIAFVDVGTASFGVGVVASVTGSTITYGRPSVFQSSVVNGVALTKTSDGVILIFYKAIIDGLFKEATKFAEITGTTAVYGSIDILGQLSALFIEATEVRESKAVLLYRDSSNSGFGTAVVKTGSILITDIPGTAGILQETGLTGETKPVALLGGIAATNMALIPGREYFIQPDRTIGFGQTNYLLGRAIDTSRLNTRQLLPQSLFV